MKRKSAVNKNKKRKSAVNKNKKRKSAVNKNKRIGLADFARRRGVSERRVRAVVKAGKLTVKKIKGRMTVDPLVADREWNDNIDHKSRPRSLDIKNEPEEKITDADLDADLDDEINESNAGKKRLIAEAKKETWKARQAQLDYEQAAGELIAADKVRREAFEVARIVRDAVLILPDRLSPELIGVKDQATMHSLITKALNTALTELVNGLEKRFGFPAGVSCGDAAGSSANGK